MTNYTNYVTEIITGWIGYRGLFAVILASAQWALMVHWVTFTAVSLAASMFYLTLIPVLICIALIALLPGKSGITPKTLATFAIWSLLAYSLYDWVRVPMNLMVGVPFWDHWYDWGASILGSQGTLFTDANLTAGLVAHILRGWGFAMAYYLLVRRVTMLSSFVYAWAMTILYWYVFPVFVLTDALPPWIWWFTAWISHMGFAFGLWLAPKLLSHIYAPAKTSLMQESATGAMKFDGARSPRYDQDRPSGVERVSPGLASTSNYKRSMKTTLFAILSTQGFGLMVGFLIFGYVVGSQPPSIYPVFGYGKPPPIVIDGFSSYYWAIPAAIIGFVFLYLALRSQKKELYH
jgi:hypothetical protein